MSDTLPLRLNEKIEPEFCGPFNMKTMRESLAVAERLASAALLTSPAARRRLKARNMQICASDVDPQFVPPKEVLLYLVRMGSFSSTPKIDNPDSADNDVIGTMHPCSREDLLDRCQRELEAAARPPLIPRAMRTIEDVTEGQSPLRIFQWNALSQSLGVTNDHFTLCPAEALDWKSRRFQLLEEIITQDPDIICLQEIDHFNFFEAALGAIGYEGKFMAKPDSPCVYLEGNNGPDGCALFYKTSRLEFLTSQTRILEVWRVQSNQVGLAAVLKDRVTGKEMCVATTHLKARSGALLATLRDNQGKDLLDWLQTVAGGRPVVLTGDFNAEPTEPVYHTTVNHRLHLRSAFCTEQGEPAYTTWKYRKEGEETHTIDYVFHSSSTRVVALQDFPTEEQLGPCRAPSLCYPSDHFSLVVDLIF